MTGDGNAKLSPEPGLGLKAGPSVTELPALATQHLNGMRVLIAEDTWHTAVTLQKTIESAGGRITGMASTLADLERMAGADCEAVIMDLNLNGQMAHELAGQLAARGLRVVVLSGYRRPLSLAAGIHAFLEKPCAGDDLIAAILGPARSVNDPQPGQQPG